MYRRSIALFLMLVLIINLININPVMTVHAANNLFKWNKNDTIDSGLQIVQNKSGDDEVFLECDMTSSGTYDLEYYLDDSERTTIQFTQQYDQLDISYKVEQMSTTTTGAVTIANITQDLVDNAYLEMDYSASVPDWVYMSDKTVDATSGALEYTVEKNASSQYPGVAFKIADKKVIIKWDFQLNKLYYLIAGYNAGNIMPVTYTIPNGTSKTVKILKALEDFEVNPTHLINDGGTNIELTPITRPSNVEAGSRPGLEMTFKQPKEFDDTDWTYKDTLTDLTNLKAVVEVSDISSNIYTDFNFNLIDSTVDVGSMSTGKAINELPDADSTNSGVIYVYDPDTNQYKIDIVKDKSDLANQNEIIQWDSLAASKIYNVTISIQVDSGFTDYQFGQFLPETKFAYTYLSYNLKRANMSEAYLDIMPYDVGSEDDVQYTILYSKVIKTSLDPTDDLWVKHYYTDTGTGEHINIPVPFKGDSSQDVYQVIVNFSGTDLVSQVLNYRAKEDLNVPPTTPKITSIDNLYVVPSEDASAIDPSKAQFDLTFSAPENRDSQELDTIFKNKDGDSSNDRIYYELLVNDVPTDTTANPFKVIKVYEVYKEDGEYKIEKYSGVPGTDNPSSRVNFSNGYDITDELFRMDDVSIYQSGDWTDVLNTEADEDNNTYSVTDTNTPYDFAFPGVNYIRLRAITEIDGKIGVSYLSVPTSLSLSLLKYDVPIADGLSYDPITGTVQTDPVGIDLQWHSVDVSTYEDHMLYPINKQIDHLYYGIYISEDSDAILNLDPSDDTGVTKIEMDTSDSISMDTDTIDVLRNGGIVYFDMETATGLNTTISSEIMKLDRNTNYYVRIVTKLDVLNQSDGTNEDTYRLSEPSSMLSVTTPVIPDAPSEGEIKPLSVENFTAEFSDDDEISTSLSFDYPDEITFAQNKYAFEIVGIEDSSMPDSLSSNSIMLEDFINDSAVADFNVEMWRIIDEGSGGVLKKYDEDTGTWVTQDASLLTLGDNSIEIIDGSNTPNKVYYYYARTINVVGGSINSASSWAEATITTAPIKEPINLTVSYNSGYTYDDKTECIIRFDAPIPVNSDLENDYVMEIVVKGEEDDDYSSTKYETTLLEVNDKGEGGYTRLYYRISDLTPGKAYSIKVRIEDRTKTMETLPDGTSSYPKSAYSDRAIARTEFDQSTYDREIKYQQYIDYFESKASKLFQEPYIILEDTSTKNVVKYRDEYALGELKASANSTYKLYVADVDTNVIYLPAEFVETTNSENVTLQMDFGEESISLRPNSIGVSITSEISNEVAQMQQGDTTDIDYFIKITINNSAYSGTINSKSPASNVVDIKTEVVGSDTYESDIDNEMSSKLSTITDWKKELLTGELSTQLDTNLDDSKLLKIVQDALDVVSTNLSFSANLAFVSSLSSDTETISTSAKNMKIAVTPNNYNVNLSALKKVGSSWQSISASYLQSRYNIETKDMTSYVLVPLEATSDSLGSVYTSDEISVINKYHLDSIFNSSELKSGSMNLQKYRMIPTLASMLGATTGSDGATYLKSLGISVSSSNMYTEVTRQEILYLHTLVFAKKNNIILNNAKITDYNMIEDLDSVNKDYKNTLLIGANMGMYSLSNGKILPNEKMTIKEFIGLLSKIDQGLNE